MMNGNDTARIDAWGARQWVGMVAGPEPQEEEGLRKIVDWMQDHADELPESALLDIYRGFAASPAATAMYGDALDNELRRYAWTEHHALYAPTLLDEAPFVAPGGGAFYHPRDEPEPWLLEAYGLTLTPTKRVARPPVPHAFTTADMKGIGRTTSDSVTMALLEGLTSKDKWDVTDVGGWPRYIAHIGAAEIRLILRPNSLPIDRRSREEQCAQMHRLKERIGIRVVDALVVMIAQAKVSASPDRKAYLDAAALCDYEGHKRIKDKDGKHGHQAANMESVAESVHILANLRIAAENVPVIRRTAGSGRRGKKGQVDISFPIINLYGDETDREDGQVTTNWRYSMGEWWNPEDNRLEPPTAYINQQTLRYKPITHLYAKQLAHYLTIDLRRNVNNGRARTYTVAELVKRAGIPCDIDAPDKERDPARVKGRVEKALRLLASDGLLHIQAGAEWLGAASATLADWEVDGPKPPARKWLGGYLQSRVTVRLQADIEQRYDEIRRKKPRKIKPPASRRDAAPPRG